MRIGEYEPRSHYGEAGRRDREKFPQTKTQAKRKFLSGFVSECSGNRLRLRKLAGAPEEIRTPDPQIRSLRVGSSADNGEPLDRVVLKVADHLKK